ncbi:MAG: sensor histidine kinase, partial [Pseudoxanthomonas sp.]
KVEKPVPAARVPTLSVQPLVENAIRHGIEPATGRGRVEVDVALESGNALVTVRNTLPDSGTTKVSGHQVGVSSVHARIEALTQGKGRLETNREGDYYVARLRLPLSS